MTKTPANTKTQSPTLQAIAEQVGVSRVAVGRVLLGSGAGRIRVAEKTAAKIQKVASEMGYQPNRMAQQLAGGSSQVIGIVIDSRSPSIYFNRLSAIEKLAAEEGYRLMIGQSHGDIEQFRGYCNDFVSRGVDGVICITHRYPGYGHQVAEIFERMKNVVFIGRPASGRADLNIVAIDTAAGIRNAVTHLTQRERKRIGLILYGSGSHAMQLRKAGYIEGLTKAGFDVDERLISEIAVGEGFEPSSVSRVVDRLVDDADADAIIAVDDKVAVHTIKQLKVRGQSVPGDVAVVGYDNSELANLYEPAITSIDQQTEVVSIAAIRLMMKLVVGSPLTQIERSITVEPKVVVRETT